MPHSSSLIIQNASIFIGALASVLGTGVAAWNLHFAHSTRLSEARRLIEQISHTVHSLTDDDKAAIDAYIAHVSAVNQQETRCLLNTQQMLSELSRAQVQHAAVNESWATHSSLQFPWTDLAQSIKVLLDECRDLHQSDQRSTTHALEHRRQALTPATTDSSFIQQVPTPTTSATTVSSFIKQPPSSYTGSFTTGRLNNHSHTRVGGASSLSGYSGHMAVGTSAYAYPPHTPPHYTQPRGRSSVIPNPSAYAPYAQGSGQVRTSTGTLSSQGSGLSGSQYSSSSGTSGYATAAPSTYYTTASSSGSLPQRGSASGSWQWSTDASNERR